MQGLARSVYDVPDMTRSAWTPKERAGLAAFYPAIAAKRMQELLPGRTEKAIRQAAFDLGIKKCEARRREQGTENVNRRWHPEGPRVFKEPRSPTQ